ncbi:MAG TPA: xanthine dehydrogenase family protein molybdopterin-binding subunit [Candidatus Limnocylindrales bacterium]|nr:xanthine dehydrogenase family protein molybdopterin-binding subunit [Candidatus Limnocylindrales bacterium]
MTNRMTRPGMLVGTPVLRVNDPKLLTGKGQFVDDLRLPGMVHATILRSPVAHARIVAVDAGEAELDPNVLAVITPEAAVRDTKTLPCVFVMPGQRMTAYPVATADVVRYVGQPLGVVVARSRAAAEDAAETVRIDFAELPAVVDPEIAVLDGAPLLYPDWGTNVAIDMDGGDPPEQVEQAIAAAAHVIAMRFRIQRQSGQPMEPRGVVARWDAATRELTMWSSTQVPHHVRDGLADALGLPYDRVRVIAPDVGGGFGPKDHLYPDEVLVCLAAMRTGRPVKWIEDRREHFTATVQAREQIHEARLALDGDGRFLALHTRMLADLGAHPSNVGAGPAFVTTGLLQGPYRIPVSGSHMTCVVTNKTPVGAYRGFGMQQAAWVRERLVDEAARRLGSTPHEIRRRNMLRRDELPYTTRTNQRYDSGDYIAALDRAVTLVTPSTPPPDDGRRRGIGLSSYVEFTGLGPTAVQQSRNFRLGGYETARVRLEPDGTATLLTGVCPHGQGLETSLAQLVADQLGLPIEDVKVVFGDTATAPYSSAGTIASRSMAVGGGATVRAAGKVRQKLLQIAANALEASPDDLELTDRTVRVRGTPKSAITIRSLAEQAWLGWGLPPGVAPGLEEQDIYDPEDISYSYATHAAAIAVDVKTGQIEVERYIVVHDCGVIVNPMIVDGQIHGGVAQGLGGALLEEVVYDPTGQPLTTTYMDYLIPTSAEVPDMVVEHSEIPSPFIPGGMKGMGEGGTIAPPAALGNALANAMPEIAHLVTTTPLSLSTVWSWIARGSRTSTERA